MTINKPIETSDGGNQILMSAFGNDSGLRMPLSPEKNIS